MFGPWAHIALAPPSRHARKTSYALHADCKLLVLVLLVTKHQLLSLFMLRLKLVYTMQKQNEQKAQQFLSEHNLQITVKQCSACSLSTVHGSLLSVFA